MQHADAVCQLIEAGQPVELALPLLEHRAGLVEQLNPGTALSGQPCAPRHQPFILERHQHVARGQVDDAPLPLLHRERTGGGGRGQRRQPFIARLVPESAAGRVKQPAVPLLPTRPVSRRQRFDAVENARRLLLPVRAHQPPATFRGLGHPPFGGCRQRLQRGIARFDAEAAVDRNQAPLVLLADADRASAAYTEVVKTRFRERRAVAVKQTTLVLQAVAPDAGFVGKPPEIVVHGFSHPRARRVDQSPATGLRGGRAPTAEGAGLVKPRGDFHGARPIHIAHAAALDDQQQRIILPEKGPCTVRASQQPSLAIHVPIGAVHQADYRQAAQKPRQWLLRKDLGQIAQAAGRQRAGLLVEKRPGQAVAVPLLNPEAPFGPAADHFVARTGQQSPATRKKPSLAIAKHQPREIRRRHRTGAGESQPDAQQGNPALHGASLKPWKTAWRTICSMCW